MLRIEREFVGHVLTRQRLLRPAAHMGLPLLDHAAIAEPGADMASVVVRIGIVRGDHEFHFCRECEHTRIADRAFRESAKPDAAMDKAGREQIGRGELGGVAVARTLFVGERFPQPVHGAFSDLADELGDVFSPDTARGKPPRASRGARMPDCAAQPACSRLVQAPSARYSMMPPAMLPAMPSASTICLALSPRAAPTPAAAPIAPKIAVGWKPALWTAFGTTRLNRQSTSVPTAIPINAIRPSGLCRSHAASTAGTITAPACTGPPSNVSSKSSPCAAVPLTKAAPAAFSVRVCPIPVQAPSSSQPASALLI